MLQRDGSGPIFANIAGGGRCAARAAAAGVGGRTAGRAAVGLALGLQHRAGACVNVVVILGGADKEHNFIFGLPIVDVQLCLHSGGVRSGNARVGKGCGPGLRFSDIGGVPCRAALRLAIGFAGILDHRAGARVNVIIIFRLVDDKFDLVDKEASFAVQLRCAEADLLLRNARMRAGCGLGLLFSDVGFLTGSTRTGNLLRGQTAGVRNERDLVYAQRRQRVKAQGGVLRDERPNQRGFALGDAVLLRQRGEIVAFRHGLGQHCGLQRAAGEQAVDGGGNACLQLGGFCRVVVFYGNEDGVLKLAQIAVLQHGAHKRVDRHLQLRALEVHAADDGLGVRVQRGNVDHPLPCIDRNAEAGVHVQHNAGLDRVCTAPDHKAQCAHAEDQRRGGGGESGGAKAAGGSAFFRACLPQRSPSRILSAGGAEFLGAIRGRMHDGGFDAPLHASVHMPVPAPVHPFVGHISPSPSIVF